MKIWNTYTNQLEDFVPKREKEVSMYVCGPTVYDHIHIGNARPVIFFDTVTRYFSSLGYHVRFASNFTDVDDRIIERARKEQRTELEVGDYYIRQFLEAAESLGSKTDYIQPRVTEYMDKIIDFIQEHVEKEAAYVVDGDVFFRVSKVAEYGHLSNRNLDELQAGARIELNQRKESPLDFVLWKKTDSGIHWHSPFSDGRPGWHTECVVMVDSIFHSEIDIHGGGSDLVFPHHENEIAQAIVSRHHRLARYWLHNGRLNIDGAEMHKSEGNALFVKDLPGDKRAFRLFMLSTHYRSPINFRFESLSVYENEWKKLENTIKSLFRNSELATDQTPIQDRELAMIQQYETQFIEAMELDFNTPNAITALWGLTKQANIFLKEKASGATLKKTVDQLRAMLDILGVPVCVKSLSADEKKLFAEWETLRLKKEWAKADELRKELQKRELL